MTKTDATTPTPPVNTAAAKAAQRQGKADVITKAAAAAKAAKGQQNEAKLAKRHADLQRVRDRLVKEHGLSPAAATAITAMMANILWGT
jgi:hypothetical protein